MLSYVFRLLDLWCGICCVNSISSVSYDITVKILVILQVVNDLLNPAGQNLRIREDTQVYVLFSFDSCF